MFSKLWSILFPFQISTAAEVKQQRLTGDIHFKTREAFSAKKQKASGLYEKKTTLAWSATPTRFPGSPWATLPPDMPTGVNHRTTTQGFPCCPPGAPKGACNAHTSERPASRPIAGVLPPVPRFSIAHCLF